MGGSGESILGAGWMMLGGVNNTVNNFKNEQQLHLVMLRTRVWETGKRRGGRGSQRTTDGNRA